MSKFWNSVNSIVDERGLATVNVAHTPQLETPAFSHYNPQYDPLYGSPESVVLRCCIVLGLSSQEIQSIFMEYVPCGDIELLWRHPLEGPVSRIHATDVALAIGIIRRRIGVAVGAASLLGVKLHSDAVPVLAAKGIMFFEANPEKLPLFVGALIRNGTLSNHMRRWGTPEYQLAYSRRPLIANDRLTRMRLAVEALGRPPAHTSDGWVGPVADW